MEKTTILYQDIKHPLGTMRIGVFNEQLCLSDWTYRRMRKAVDKRLCAYFNATMKEDKNALITKAWEEILAYLNGEIKQFNTPLIYAGSAFQKKVWDALLKIPYGKITTYLKLSEEIQQKEAIRAVASANGANALSIFVPCHRVIGSNGELCGYAGGLSVKQKLLHLEQSSKQLSFEF